MGRVLRTPPAARGEPGARLPRAFFARRSPVVARALIGKLMVHRSPAGPAGGVVVEVEAYDQRDPASHSFAGETARNRVMFGEAGHAYVYFSYGVHWCFNVSAETARVGAGVLVRALEPLAGIELMQRRRGADRLADLARGPGRLTAAMGIDKRLDGVDLCAAGSLWLAAASKRVGPIGRSVRIGITKEAHRRLRFYERGSVFVSGSLALRN